MVTDEWSNKYVQFYASPHAALSHQHSLLLINASVTREHKPDTILYAHQLQRRQMKAMIINLKSGNLCTSELQTCAA